MDPLTIYDRTPATAAETMSRKVPTIYKVLKFKEPYLNEYGMFTTSDEQQQCFEPVRIKAFQMFQACLISRGPVSMVSGFKIRITYSQHPGLYLSKGKRRKRHQGS